MDLLAVTLVHGRAPALKAFGENMRRVGIPWVAAVTNTDLHGKMLCEEYAMDYIEAQNKPLGQKWNRAMDLAKLHGPSRVMLIGSDDLVNDHWAQAARKFSSPGPIMVPRYYEVYDVQKKQAMSVQFTKAPPFPIGISCMVLTEEAIDLAEWNPDVEKALDTDMLAKLVKQHKLPCSWSHPVAMPAFIALKTGSNIWHMQHFKNWLKISAVDDMGRRYQAEEFEDLACDQSIIEALKNLSAMY